MKTKCYSVRFESLTRISGRAFKVRSFDGSTDIIPASQIFGEDLDVQKSNAVWIAAWILEKKNIQYSTKKEAWFDDETRCMIPSYRVERHTPDRIDPVESNEISELKK